MTIDQVQSLLDWAWPWVPAAIGVLLLIVLVWRRLPQGKPDIEWEPLEADLKWDDPDAVSASTKKIYDHVLNGAAGTIDWYRKGRQPKRRRGLALRSGAVVLTGLASVAPVADKVGLNGIDPVWSTILLAAAGLRVARPAPRSYQRLGALHARPTEDRAAPGRAHDRLEHARGRQGRRQDEDRASPIVPGCSRSGRRRRDP